jgi:hypothetical protein
MRVRFLLLPLSIVHILILYRGSICLIKKIIVDNISVQVIISYKDY